jgi:hypothetical protein
MPTTVPPGKHPARPTPGQLGAARAFLVPSRFDRHRLAATLAALGSPDDAVVLAAARRAEALRAVGGIGWKALLSGRVGCPQPFAHAVDDPDIIRGLLRWEGHLHPRELRFVEAAGELQRPLTPRERSILATIGRRVDHHLRCEWTGAAP